MPFIQRQFTECHYLNFIIQYVVKIKHWNSSNFEVRTAVLLIVRVQRKSVLVDMNIDGLAETVDLADNTPTAVIYVISCYLYHTYCTSRMSVTLPPVLHFYTYDSSVRLHFRSDASIGLLIFLGTDSSLIICEDI